MSSIAILIDCWLAINSDAIKNIKQYCVDNTSIKTIVLSSYNSFDGVSLHQPYWNNSNELFNSETRFDQLKQEWCNANFEDEPGTVPELLENWTRPDQFLMSAFSSLQILYYCNYVNKDIDKIYFFGRAWDVCVKYRPVGWMEIDSLNFHNLFHTKQTLLTRSGCVCDTENKLVSHFDDNWEKSPGGNHRLKKIIRDKNES